MKKKAFLPVSFINNGTDEIRRNGGQCRMMRNGDDKDVTTPWDIYVIGCRLCRNYLTFRQCEVAFFSDGDEKVLAGRKIEVLNASR